LYAIVCRLEEKKYDWEGRLVRHTKHTNELNDDDDDRRASRWTNLVN